MDWSPHFHLCMHDTTVHFLVDNEKCSRISNMSLRYQTTPISPFDSSNHDPSYPSEGRVSIKVHLAANKRRSFNPAIEVLPWSSFTSGCTTGPSSSGSELMLILSHSKPGSDAACKTMKGLNAYLLRSVSPRSRNVGGLIRESLSLRAIESGMSQATCP